MLCLKLRGLLPVNSVDYLNLKLKLKLKLDWRLCLLFDYIVFVRLIVGFVVCVCCLLVIGGMVAGCAWVGLVVPLCLGLWFVRVC